MIPSIFSSFDPASNLIFFYAPTFFWLIALTTIILAFPSLWATSNRPDSSINSLLSIPFNQTSLSQANHLKSFPLILASLFLLILFLNLTGNLPYVFSISSHFLFSISFAFPMWLALLTSQTNTFSHEPLLLHSIPNASPIWLTGPIVFIEFIRNIIRPLTLGLRLAINITAGHVIVGIMSQFLTNFFVQFDTLPLTILLGAATGYSIFELAISSIQTYIFCLLLSLYSNDHPSS